jgi:hypothetical protein
MKTFDIAIKYLDDQFIDFKQVDVFTPNRKEIPDLERQILAQIVEQREKYLADPEAKCSEEQRLLIFNVAALHLTYKYKKMVSFVFVIRAIIESEMVIPDSDTSSVKIACPDSIIEKWCKYCDEMDDQPYWLNVSVKYREQLLLVVFDYLMNNEKE